MESINNLFSVINTEDATLIYGGSEFSNWVCEMFGKLCHGLTQENGADVCKWRGIFPLLEAQWILEY